MDSSRPLPRRQLLQQGARALGAISLGGTTIDLLTSGCARQPPSTTTVPTRLMHVQFTVEGTLRSTIATPFYYLCVINLTNDASDPGPVPIQGLPANGIAVPATSSGSGTYQTFVGYILYDTSLQNYTCYTCPIIGTGPSAVFESAAQVNSYSQFLPIYSPDLSVLPSAGAPNTFDATINLHRLKPDPSLPLPRYAQVNVITYNYLASNGGFNGVHYWDGIGSGGGSNDYAVLDTTQSQTITSANFGAPQGDVQNQYGQAVSATSDPAIPNLYITGWAITIQ